MEIQLVFILQLCCSKGKLKNTTIPNSLNLTVLFYGHKNT